MIILEGCDCTGKTTLAKKLSERYDSPVTHYSEHNDLVMKEHVRECKPFADEIVDRFHLSEIPYSMYYRHGIPNYDSVRDIDLAIRNKENNLQIVCTPPWTIVKARWEGRREEELIQSLQSLHGIYMWYRDKAQAFSSTQVWNYDYTLTSFDSLCEEINEWKNDNG